MEIIRNKRLIIKFYIWRKEDKDFSGKYKVFNYINDENHKKIEKELIFIPNKFNIMGICQFNNKNEIEIIEGQQSDLSKNEENILFGLDIDNQKNFIISKDLKLKKEIGLNENYFSNKFWYVAKQWDDAFLDESKIINESNNQEFYLSNYDLISLGKLLLIISDVYLNNPEDNQQENILSVPSYKNYKNDDINNPYYFSLINKNEYANLPPYKVMPEIQEDEDDKKEYFCKICNKNFSSESNPLIRLCKCKDAMGFCHYKCIKNNINCIKSENKFREIFSFTLLDFYCDKCDVEYPIQFIYKNKIFYFLDDLENLKNFNKKYDKQYIILESFNGIHKKYRNKYIFCIKLTEYENLIIGRGKKVDIRIPDVSSISENHCALYYEKKEKALKINDCKSMFGTLILLKDNFKVAKNEVQIQIGRILCKFINEDE